MTTVSNLCQKQVRRENGESLGHIQEIHADHGRAITMVCGPRGWIQRLMYSRKGHRIRIDDIVRVTQTEIIVRDAR